MPKYSLRRHGANIFNIENLFATARRDVYYGTMLMYLLLCTGQPFALKASIGIAVLIADDQSMANLARTIASVFFQCRNQGN